MKSIKLSEETKHLLNIAKARILLINAKVYSKVTDDSTIQYVLKEWVGVHGRRKTNNTKRTK